MWSRTAVATVNRSAHGRVAFLRPKSSGFQRPQPRLLSSEAASAAAGVTHDKVVLNFSLPHAALYDSASVQSIILPGLAGEYGITAHHVPYVAQLKAGVVQIFHDEGGSSSSSEAEKYFVPGGYALTHENSVTDVICPEAIKLDELDASVVSSQYESAKATLATAVAGSPEHAHAQIQVDVNRAMGVALGLNMS